MHFGRLNQGRSYSVHGRALERVTEQAYLGVHVHHALKVELQVDSGDEGIQHAWFQRSEH